MPRRVCKLKHRGQGARRGWHVDAGAAEDEAVSDPPRRAPRIRDEVAEVPQLLVLLELLADVVQGKRWP